MTISFRSWSESCLSTVNEFLTDCPGAAGRGGARGRQLVTLKDAGDYITKVPKAEHEAAEWQLQLGP